MGTNTMNLEKVSQINVSLRTAIVSGEKEQKIPVNETVKNKNWNLKQGKYKQLQNVSLFSVIFFFFIQKETIDYFIYVFVQLRCDDRKTTS